MAKRRGRPVLEQRGRLAGLGDREIAESLDRPYETIRTLQRRALIRLQAILGITAVPAGEAPDADH